ncbi:hypothetical protein D3C76_356130 [compost metagenome]
MLMVTGLELSVAAFPLPEPELLAAPLLAALLPPQADSRPIINTKLKDKAKIFFFINVPPPSVMIFVIAVDKK